MKTDNLFSRCFDLALTTFLTLLVLGLLIGSCGCSHVEQIADSAVKISNHARAIKDDTKIIRQATTNPVVVAAANDIDGHADGINAEVAKVQKNLTGVADVTPWWATMMKWIAAAVILVVLFLVAWRLNLFIFLEAFVQVISTWTHKMLGKIMGA